MTRHQDASGKAAVCSTTLPSPLSKHATGTPTTVSACPLSTAFTRMAPLPMMLPVSVVRPDARRLQDFIATNQKTFVLLVHHAQSLMAPSLIQDRAGVATLVAQQVQDCTATKQNNTVILAHHAQSLTAPLLIQDHAVVATSDATMPWV